MKDRSAKNQHDKRKTRNGMDKLDKNKPDQTAYKKIIERYWKEIPQDKLKIGERQDKTTSSSKTREDITRKGKSKQIKTKQNRKKITEDIRRQERTGQGRAR
jgi:hypothetical protein